MNSRSTNDGQQELIGELRRRFPLFERLVGRFGDDTPEERLPWFFALLLSAAMKSGPGACCFVLDKTQGTTAVAAVLLALIKLQDDFPELVKNYARTALRQGQRVKVKPSNYVYNYDGPWEEYPDFFRLKVLGEESWLSFRMSEVLRLEPTDRVRPKGTLNSSLGKFERSRLDELLDLSTCGNNSMIRNTVLLHMAQTQFAEVADNIALSPENTPGFGCLSGFLPWGSIGHDGELKSNDTYQVEGEPIVAATRVPEDLAFASSAAPVATRVVFVDGARGLVRDMQAVDDIAERQRMIILASPDETDALALLKDRGCPIWYMSPDEILIGELSAGSRARTSLVGATIRAADTRRRVKVSKVDCGDSKLQTVAESLDRAAAMTEAGEEIHESEEMLVRLFGILFECSECCFGVGEENRDNLRAVQEQVTRHAKWMDPAVSRELQEAIIRLEGIITSESFGEEKAAALLNILLAQDTEHWAVAAMSPRAAKNLRVGLKRLGVDLPVLPISAIRIDSDYAGVVVPAWPNKQRFSRLRNLAVTSDIRVLAYPFESKWVLHYQASELARARSNRVEIETRSSILGIEPRFLTSLTSDEFELPIPEPPEEPIFRIESRVAQRRKRPAVAVDGEESREAQMVQFVGDCYALVTQWAELHRLNQLIDTANVSTAELENVTDSRLSPGSGLKNTGAAG